MSVQLKNLWIIAKDCKIPAFLMGAALVGAYIAGPEYFDKVKSISGHVLVFALMFICSLIMGFVVKDFRDRLARAEEKPVLLDEAIRFNNANKLFLTGFFVVGELIMMGIDSYTGMKNQYTYLVLSSLCEACYVTCLTLFPSSFNVPKRLIPFFGAIVVGKYYYFYQNA